MCCFVLFLIALSVSVSAELNASNFVFYDASAPITLALGRPSLAFSRVTVWSVDLQQSVAMLQVESFVPSDEFGFWIIGFQSRYAVINKMFSRLGEMSYSDSETKTSEFCSNLPYFYKQNVEDLVTSNTDLAYIETELAEDKSIFDWSLRLKAPELIEGVSYNKSIVKSSHAKLRQVDVCMNSSVQYTTNTFTYKKTLFHTYIRIKPACYSQLPFFDVHECVNLVMEGTTVLVWTVSSTILVNSKASSTATGHFDDAKGVVTAVATTTRLFEFLDEKEGVLLTADYQLNITFTPENPDREFYFPLFGSNAFLVEADITTPWRWSLIDRGPARDDVSLDEYLNALAGTTIRKEEVLSRINRRAGIPQSSLVHFNITTDRSDKPRNATVIQKFGSVICETQEGLEGEKTCQFGTVTTTVQVSVELKITSVTEFEEEVRAVAQWYVEVSRARGKSNGDNVSPALGAPARALYATESLLLDLSVYPIHALQGRILQLIYITLTGAASNTLLLYKDEQQEWFPESVTQLEYVSSSAYGSFNCTATTGTCSLDLSPSLWSPTGGLHTLSLGIRVHRSGTSDRKRRSIIEQDEAHEQGVTSVDFTFTVEHQRKGRPGIPPRPNSSTRTAPWNITNLVVFIIVGYYWTN